MVGGVGHFSSHRSVTEHADRGKVYLRGSLAQKLGYCFKKQYKLIISSLLENHVFYLISFVIKILTKSHLEEDIYSAYEFRS